MYSYIYCCVWHCAARATASCAGSGAVVHCRNQAQPAKDAIVIGSYQAQPTKGAVLGGSNQAQPAKGDSVKRPADPEVNSIDNVSSPYTAASFESLRELMHPDVMVAIRGLNFPTMREIQAKTIPLLLQGHNLRYRKI